MSDWVRLCAASEAPKAGEVAEVEVKGSAVCLANVNGRLTALENTCPHRGGPLGQGRLEGECVVCPWHSWSFDTRTGQALAPDCGKVNVLPIKMQGDEIWIDID